MKRRWIMATLMLFAVAAVVYGATAITVNPSEMKNGETKSLVDGRNTITVRRDGDDVTVKIEGAGTTQSLTITRSGDSFRISRDGVSGGLMVVPPEPWRVPAEVFREKRQAQTWFVCPTDHTMLRVPAGKDDQIYKCPVDGTTMEKRKMRGFGLFFDDNDFGFDSL